MKYLRWEKRGLLPKKRNISLGRVKVGAKKKRAMKKIKNVVTYRTKHSTR